MISEPYAYCRVGLARYCGQRAHKLGAVDWNMDGKRESIESSTQGNLLLPAICLEATKAEPGSARKAGRPRTGWTRLLDRP